MLIVRHGQILPKLHITVQFQRFTQPTCLTLAIDMPSMSMLSPYKHDPSSNDIGGLVVGDIGNFHSEHDIIIEHSSGSLQRISKLHPKFMSLQYPLLFPYGDDGYQCNIMFADQDHQPQGKHSQVPMRAYYAYLINKREG
jgi:hypothetical protein